MANILLSPTSLQSGTISRPPWLRDQVHARFSDRHARAVPAFKNQNVWRTVYHRRFLRPVNVSRAWSVLRYPRTAALPFQHLTWMAGLAAHSPLRSVASMLAARLFHEQPGTRCRRRRSLLPVAISWHHGIGRCIAGGTHQLSCIWRRSSAGAVEPSIGFTRSRRLMLSIKAIRLAPYRAGLIPSRTAKMTASAAAAHIAGRRPYYR